MTATVETLGAKDLHTLRAMLARDPVHNLYLLGLLEEFGIVPAPYRAHFAFHGRVQRGELLAAMFVGGQGGLVIPSASDEPHVSAIASTLCGKVKLKAALGERTAVDALVKQLAGERGSERTFKVAKNQRLFAVSADDLGPFTNPTLRPAAEKDLDQLVSMSAHAVIETLGRGDPLFEDPDGFKARVLQRIRGRRTYVLEEKGRLVFKIDIGSRSQYGAELEGLYTLPDERRKGHATLSLGQISRHLLSSLPRLTLRVDESDPSLAGVARKVGFVPQKVMRLVMADR